MDARNQSMGARICDQTRKPCDSNPPCKELSMCALAAKVIKENSVGLRYNKDKPRYDHIPPAFLKALAQHFTAGNMHKYADPPTFRNWEKGLDIGDCLRAAMSHITEYNLGHKLDDVDPLFPPGYRPHHLIAAAWNLIVVYEMERRGIGTDSRPPAQFEEPKP